MRNIFFLLTFVFVSFSAFSQEVTKIILDSANNLSYDKSISPEFQRLLGHVVMRHDSATMYCDSAYLNNGTNSVRAFGNIRIRLSDTLNLYGDSLQYNGNTRIAKVKGNVELQDNETLLTTDSLTYDRNTKTAMYDFWGKIVNNDNTLVSKYGYYYTDRKEFFFKEKVILINPDYVINSDTMMHNTVTDMSYFYGPSTIVGKEDSIYCENGWYNSANRTARFRKNGKIYHENQMLTGDSIYYERTTGFGQVFKNGYLIDTVKNIILTGNYGEIRRTNGYAFMTDSAVARMVEKKDTLFVHSDTIYSSFDTSQNIKNIRCFYKVKFFRRDLQGLCDSLVYHGADSTMIMYHEPVMWSDSNQLTSDSISLHFRNQQPDSMVMYNSAFIVSQDDTNKFNQVKGRDMIAYFVDNQLYKIKVIGNAETIYYFREEDKSLIGIDKAQASNMLIYLGKNQIETITYIDKAAHTLWPEKEISVHDLKLRGFVWLEEKRPKKMQDIFKK